MPRAEDDGARARRGGATAEGAMWKAETAAPPDRRAPRAASWRLETFIAVE